MRMKTEEDGEGMIPMYLAWLIRVGADDGGMKRE